MKVRFRIHYDTDWGQSIYVIGSDPNLGEGDLEHAYKLDYMGDGFWEGSLEIRESEFRYKYAIKSTDSGFQLIEFGAERHIHGGKNAVLELRDDWRGTGLPENNLYRAPFSNAFFKRNVEAKKSKAATGNVNFRLFNPRISKNYKVGILGSCKSLGAWNSDNVKVLHEHEFPVWNGSFKVDASEFPVSYKYVIYDPVKKNIVEWEEGENRILNGDAGSVLIKTDNSFRHHNNWRGAGVAIPVFSLRTENGTGIGEFTDLKLLTDWAVKSGLKLIQVLPINDTTANYSWTDSYPYAGISVQALHPIYTNLQAMGDLKDKSIQQEISEERKRLNALPTVDYESVIKLKMRFLEKRFEEVGAKTLASTEYSGFYLTNKGWLDPYAAFCALRDKYATPDFNTWGKYSSLSKAGLDRLIDAGGELSERIQLYFFIQFHLDKQLKEATTYAREKGVVLKGDIPIGIYRNSVDAWMNPDLFNMDCQAGAPPDDFSVTGQNWGFPTYKWEVMHQNGFQWWRRRLQKMADYFDVTRIDHILGFFRIWEVPINQVQGVFGRFNPSLPFSPEELADWGIYPDADRFCKPYIRRYMLEEMFNTHVDMVAERYLYEYAPGCFELKADYDTQQKIRSHFDQRLKEDPSDFNRWLREGLYKLVAEVVLLADSSHENHYYPRVGMHGTFSFRDLDELVKRQLDYLYNHFYYERHNDFWRQSAMVRLPAVKEASNMLICGEDLGMVPSSVPGVMSDLNILSLAIQRMPNDDRLFWHPKDTPYESVTSTSSHDTSTLREWWEEDSELSADFYRWIIGRQDDPPQFMEPWLAEAIIKQHMHSPSMWAIFPIQDLLAMDGTLRRDLPADERINIPADPMHYWRYRMHISIEDLLKSNAFNSLLQRLAGDSGRNNSY